MPTLRYPKRGSVLLRHGRWSEPGRVYLITVTTACRTSMFDDWEVALAAVRAMRSPHIWRRSLLLCWVLMPDHWHGLIELGDADGLSLLVRRLKGVAARNVNRQCDRQGSLWADGFHDHAVRVEEDLIDLARYIILNPVRAGLVDKVGAYPFWDAVWINAVHRG